MFHRHVLLLALFCSITVALDAQRNFRIAPGVVIGDTLQLHELILVNYSNLLGNCLAIDEDYIRFKPREASKATKIPVADVRYIDLYFEGEKRTAGGIKIDKPYSGGSEINFSDPTYHRTALPWKGKGQLRITNVVYSVAEFNLNKNIQLGVGTSLLFGVLTTQKLRFRIGESLNFGISQQAFLPVLIDVEEVTLIGDVAANITLGSSDRWLSLGGGFLYSTADDEMPTHINLSMGGRIGEKWHLYGELSIIDDGSNVNIFPAFSAAHTIRRHRWRYGFFNVISPFNSNMIPIPLIGYEYHW